MTLVVHAGGRVVTKDDLALVEIPQATESYQPVPHDRLADTLAVIGGDILKGFQLEREQYALARNGQQMFGVLTFRGEDELGLDIGFRNSYDRSMSIGIAIGGHVFVCDNLALTGEVTVLKKHTKNVWNVLEDTAIQTLYRSQKNFRQVIADCEALKRREFGDEEAFAMLGRLFGHGILSPRQLPVVKEEWFHPRYEEFQPRNAWSFYNAATESLKTCPPLVIMEKHIQLHALLTA